MNLEDTFFIEKLKRSTPFEMTHSHAHNKYEIYYLEELTGNAEITIDHENYPLQKGSLVVINSLVSHRTNFLKANSHCRYLIEIQPEFFQKSLLPLLQTTPDFFFQQHTGVYPLTVSKQKQIKSVFAELDNEMLFKEEFYETRVQLLTLDLMILINRFSKEKILNQKVGSIQKETLKPILRYVAEHYNEEITLTDVADNFFLNKSYLARIFKKYTGQTLIDFVNSKRISQAQRLITLYPELTFSQLATSCGFSSISHFSKAFKKYTGLTPKEFKHQIIT